MKKLSEQTKQELMTRGFALQIDIAGAIKFVQQTGNYKERQSLGLSNQDIPVQIENVYQNFYKCLHSLNIATALIDRAGLTKDYKFAIGELNEIMQAEEKRRMDEKKKINGNGKIILMPRGHGGQS